MPSVGGHGDANLIRRVDRIVEKNNRNQGQKYFPHEMSPHQFRSAKSEIRNNFKWPTYVKFQQFLWRAGFPTRWRTGMSALQFEVYSPKDRKPVLSRVKESKSHLIPKSLCAY